jgi:hypothetical protein
VFTIAANGCTLGWMSSGSTASAWARRVVGLHRGVHGVEQLAIGTEHAQLVTQSKQVTNPRAGQRTPAALPTLDRVPVQTEQLGERLLRQAEGLPRELEHVPGDDPTTRLATGNTATGTHSGRRKHQVSWATWHMTTPNPISGATPTLGNSYGGLVDIARFAS